MCSNRDENIIFLIYIFSILIPFCLVNFFKFTETHAQIFTFLLCNLLFELIPVRENEPDSPVYILIVCFTILLSHALVGSVE